MKKIQLFDTTLRDGAQSAGVSFSVEDKLKIARALDAFGMDYIEGGWPMASPSVEEFFRQASKIKFKHATLVAFGSTRHKANKAHQDPNLKTIVASGVKVACIFGKTWNLHVTHALNTTLDDNLKMIAESVAYLRSQGLKVIYDAEHFFDGYSANPAYAMATLRAAANAGAFTLCLCETNGGKLPSDIRELVGVVRSAFPKIELGIHAHNDSDCAVANSIVAVQEGCTMVQGTVNGLGERCGNANLCSIIPALQYKLGCECLTQKQMQQITELSFYVDEVANVVPNDNQPYVGRNAFAHKAGIHASAVARLSATYEHMDPVLVGNERRILVSEMAGKSNVACKAKELDLDFEKDPKAATKIIEAVKEYENNGYQFEDADGSFVLLTKKALGEYVPSFTLKTLRVTIEKNAQGEMISEATIKLDIKGQEVHTVAEGDGPVNAMDNSLRKALLRFYPEIENVSLMDFKVRVINAGAGTAARVRVLIESKDAHSTWGTIGVSENLIDASWKALVDAVEYKLLKKKMKDKK